MKLTKRERHKYYKLALKDFKENNRYYMCVALKNSLKNIVDIDRVLDYFPELASKKPKKIWLSGIYTTLWYNPDNRSIRVKLLNRCIKETAPKSK